ncbi:MAG TPA: M28 family peptidase [Chitinophagaceae bacterium]
MRLILLLLLLPFCFSSNAQVKEKKIRKFAKTIKAEELRDKLSIIASAEMEGRATATEGQRKAAAYIEAQFRSIGLLPGNGDSYQQIYPVYQDSLLSVLLSADGKVLEQGVDYMVNLAASWNAEKTFNEIVFAGYGISDSAYDDLEGLDLRGKMVLIMEGEPKREGKYLVSGTDRPSPRWFNPNVRISNLRQRGAAAILYYQRVPRGAANNRGGLYNKPNQNSGLVYMIYPAGLKKLVGDEAAARVHAMATNNSIPSKEAWKHEVKASLSKAVKRLQSSNVLGLLPGSDKSDEYVFITAHYDHLGKRGDSVIYYGADDDGSGTTSVIELAEAFACAAKKGYGSRRNIVFMTVSGEEMGLWGSEYYSEHPVYPLEKTNVDLNIDMVGRIDPKYQGDSLNYVYVIGDDKLSSQLRPVTDSINRKYLGMELDRRFNDITDPNRYYYRSDHYHFARKGVPVIFYFNGTHADYHRPTDTVDKIRFDLMEKRVKLVYYTAWEMANAGAMLKRDIPLNIPPR